MRKVIRWTARIVVLLAVILVVVGLWQRERITRLMAVNSLFSQEKIVGNFIAMDTMFESAAIDAGDTPSELPFGAQMTLPDGYDAWTTARSVTAIVVLKDGQIVHEAYPLTAAGEDAPATSRRISWSVAKSFLSVLIGVLVEDGDIESLDDPVTKYAPELSGSAYDGASLRDVLQMSSGVTFNEDYLNFWSDINKMGRVLALGQSMDGFAAGLTETFAPPGRQWQYVSIDTHVIGMVARGATGRSVPDLLREKVIAPLGLAVDPYYVTDGYRVAFVLGGMNMTTRDYARFGAMVARGGVWNGTRIVSADWIVDSTAASAPTAPGAIEYGYQWWIPVDAQPGQFMARGIYGQYIYIDQPRGVVIAVNSADRQFRDAGVSDDNIAMFRALAERAAE